MIAHANDDVGAQRRHWSTPGAPRQPRLKALAEFHHAIVIPLTHNDRYWAVYICVISYALKNYFYSSSMPLLGTPPDLHTRKPAFFLFTFCGRKSLMKIITPNTVAARPALF